MQITLYNRSSLSHCEPRIILAIDSHAILKPTLYTAWQSKLAFLQKEQQQKVPTGKHK